MSNRICSICARGGSKGVPGKNYRHIAGLPLISYSIRQAKKSNLFKHIVVSSDSEDILSIAKQEGVDLVIKRSDDLATDSSAKLPVIQDCINRAEEHFKISYSTIVDLDCTSPLREIEDLVGAVKLLESGDCDNVVTGCLSRRSPYFNLLEEVNDRVVLSKKINFAVYRRQDSPITYDMNASIYVWRGDTLKLNKSVISDNTKIYVMPEDRSIDIDSELDFSIVEFLLKQKQSIDGKAN